MRQATSPKQTVLEFQNRQLRIHNRYRDFSKIDVNVALSRAHSRTSVAAFCWPANSPCCKPKVSCYKYEKDGEDFLQVLCGESEGYVGAKQRAHHKTGSDPHRGRNLYEAVTIIVPSTEHPDGQ